MPKILVVDDNQGIADILEQYLAVKGMEVIKAIGGEKALEILGSDTTIDLMVVDMKMTKVSGIDVIKRAKELGKHFPILLLTGTIETEDYLKQLENFNFKEDDILHKPVDLPELVEKIKAKLKSLK